MVANLSLTPSPTPSTSFPQSFSCSYNRSFRWRILPHQSRSVRRHHRRRFFHPDIPNQLIKPTSNPVEKFQMTIDVEDLSNKASISFQKLLNPSLSITLDQLIESGKEALEDLQTLVTFDSDRRIVVSCRPSTVEFMVILSIGCFLSVFAFKVFLKLGLGVLRRFKSRSSDEVIVRRDRSLGGREVVVARRNDDFSILQSVSTDSEVKSKNLVRKRKARELPNWWPVSLPPPIMLDHQDEYQILANRFIRAILDRRIHGKDISEDDMIQFRRLCRTSGAKVSIDTSHSRDSFYRASVEFVLNICCRSETHYSTESKSTRIYIDGEPAQQFIAGLADNLQLEHTRAARIVCAAVAAQTRLCFLQAWALEMQGKHSDALSELSKICTLHQVFPPEESSPEMEMVARGIEKQLKLEQRKWLMDMLTGVCVVGSHRSAAEALGLSSEDLPDQEHRYLTS
ncbi:uncharacterized protein LOC124922037 isoform X2 [Impatiens glandulifera]|uniref:uncharacterized protein LOC124922037 isoform X2 n=1 Tax=Impatiens glandulifera TaxID=253017 RepID=UPI001FB17653|nr:uncharacterized protein LOC124922037 isoform X2 [Impatiens glandulifera]